MVAIKDMGFPSCCANCNLVELDKIDNFYCGYTHHYCDNQNNERNSDCPLVEAEEHKAGKWILIDEESNTWQCSHCIELGKDDWWQLNSGTPQDNKMDYCPHCGVEMRGAEND